DDGIHIFKLAGIYDKIARHGQCTSLTSCAKLCIFNLFQLGNASKTKDPAIHFHAGIHKGIFKQSGKKLILCVLKSGPVLL
ncbi:hypothetical protein, partial [Escherichia coli]|uniref:hypothetical protein n=1 Tax=Escherichia coli TaxID=562 RepID=UPI004067FD02